MIRYVRDLRNGCACVDQLQSVLNHPDYQFECERYDIACLEPFITYFSHIADIGEADIPNFNARSPSALRDRHRLWMEAYENPDACAKQYERTRAYLDANKLDWITKQVRKGLLAHHRIPDVDIVSTMGLGPSFGYFYKGALHFDLLSIGEAMASLPSVIAHEMYHIALWEVVSKFMHSFSLEERYIFNPSGEGLAIKFCNNAAGTLSRPIDPSRAHNEGLDAYSMAYGNAHFAETLKVFVETSKGIRAGKLTGEDIRIQNETFWWNPYPEGEGQNGLPKLSQPRIYGFGNDFYGTIYDVFGSDILFDCLEHPSKAISFFQKALETAAPERRAELACIYDL